MGTNCAPYLTNLFLHYYEYNYIDNLQKTNKSQLARLLSNMFRYQDDLIVFNDDDNFQLLYKEIYPPEMELEKTNTVPF